MNPHQLKDDSALDKVVETEAGSSGFGGDVWKVDRAELAHVKNEEDRNL